jgi:hypothetical protein
LRTTLAHFNTYGASDRTISLDLPRSPAPAEREFPSPAFRIFALPAPDRTLTPNATETGEASEPPNLDMGRRHCARIVVHQSVAPQRRRSAHTRAAALSHKRIRASEPFLRDFLIVRNPMIEEDATAARTLTFLSRDRPDDIHCRPRASRRCEDVRRASLQT